LVNPRSKKWMSCGLKKWEARDNQSQTQIKEKERKVQTQPTSKQSSSKNVGREFGFPKRV